MEHDEAKALRVKAVAEEKFIAKEYDAARFHAKRARRLCPTLNFISVFITIVDIYCSKEESVGIGESDWWKSVLKLEGSWDIAKICENFCILAEIVKAGRDAAVLGAEGAFQILSEAFCNVTTTFWTKCSRCQYHFQYGSFRVYDELVCINCGECFVAVPLPSRYHPRNQRPMSYFGRRNQDTTSVVVALKVPTSKRKLKQVERMKKGDEGESSGRFEEDGKGKIV